MAINRPPVNTDASASYIAGLVAVVGCDGTGKSTLTADLVKNMQARGMSERRYLGVLSGEDGDKIKRLPIIGVWLERRLAKKSSENSTYEQQGTSLMGRADYVCFFTTPHGEFTQSTAPDKAWSIGD